MKIKDIPEAVAAIPVEADQMSPWAAFLSGDYFLKNISNLASLAGAHKTCSD
jgi:hypothetical protein